MIKIVKLTKKDWLVIIVGAIVSYFAPNIIKEVLETIPSFLNWVINNIVLVIIIALVVYIAKNWK